MKKIILIGVMLVALATTVFGAERVDISTKGNGYGAMMTERKDAKPVKIQVAILLDTSSSMDGLINQARSRLWNIINTLTTLKFKGKSPIVEIALYEYGNSGLKTADYIRQISPLSTDLDVMSEQLFSLTTNGGLEYCGAVIDNAVRTLKWGDNDSDMKLIYIAGNESFAQGSLSYKTAIDRALKHGIYVNTIHCGTNSEGISDQWKSAAALAKGKYFNIDSNARIRHISTPYDDEISACNTRLNDTYVSYGSAGAFRRESQIAQDANAKQMSVSSYTDRTLSKTKNIYNNSSWDLVDKVKDDKLFLSNVEQSELPKELQGKSEEEIKVHVDKKTKERVAIQSEITELAKKRQTYIETELKKGPSATGDDLGEAINSSILDLAKLKGYTVAK